MAVKCPKCQTDNPDTSSFCADCGARISSPKDIDVTETIESPREELTTGSTFAGRYQIVTELGKGGMGKVYRAIDKEINEEIALKLIKPEIASDKKTIERFSNELKMARKIAHRNVCKMYYLGEERGTRYITMEYVPGEDLKGMIRMMGQLGAGKAISIAKQVCEGLSEAHRLGVMHRDLKPSNVMIDKDGNVRIMDFGIARSLESKGITGAGVMIGTPEYMSPEQVEGKEVDQRSDIYSLGVILYEMVTGRVPFEGDTALTIAVKHKTEEPKDPREFNTQLSEDLSDVILKCLEKDKDKRYQSAGELRSELENIEKGIPTTERIIPERKPLTSREITVTFGLKKLFVPILVVVGIVIIGLVIWQLLPQKKADIAPLDNPSIAVLPFSDLSPQKDQESFCEGMTDEIIAKLSRLHGWKVMNRTSMMRYKNTDKDIKEIGRELNVTTILEGSVRKEKNNIRVTAQLINADDGFQLWSDIYEQKLERVFEIQINVAENIANSLKIKLTPDDKEQIKKSPTENLEAYNFYLLGRFFWNKRTEEDIKKAIDYFEQAIEKDQKYAMAYVGLAESYVVLPDYSSLLEKECNPKAREAALKALEIDSTVAEAHATLGLIYATDYDRESAEREFQLAIELNSNYATAHHWYAITLMYMARFDEAIQEIKLAQELDPLSLVITRNVGQVYFYARQYDLAIEALNRTIESDPNFSLAHYFLGAAYCQKSMYEEALAELMKDPGLGWIGTTYIRMGKKDKAHDVLEDLINRSKQDDDTLYSIAAIYFALEEKDQGFKWLENAYQINPSILSYLKIDPLFDGIRSDSRYKVWLKKINLE